MGSVTVAIAARVPTAVLAAALAACTPKQEWRDPEANANIPPKDYRPKIIDMLRDQLEDPTGIRSAGITEPMLRPFGNVSRYVVCLRFDARNSTGQYLGVKERAAFFYEGAITQIAAATPEQCGGAKYQPFPELEKLCKELRCPT